MSDVDGDGVRDYAVSTVLNSAASLDRVDLFSGATGAVIRTFVEFAPGDNFGTVLIDVGDFNGDGVGDVLVGSPQNDVVAIASGRADIVSGADGSVLWTVMGSSALDAMGSVAAAVGDLDGDGVPDFAVSSIGENNSPSWGGLVRVFSGATSQALFWMGNGGVSNDIAEGFGQALGRAGDLNGDGVNDLLIGIPGRNNHIEGRVGAIEARSGVDGSILFEIPASLGKASNSRFGESVAGDVDLNGDGVGEILVGMTNYQLNGAFGALMVFDGATQGLLAVHEGHANGNGTFGHHVAFVGDMNGDGFQDYGATFDYSGTIGYSGYVGIYSGADHTLLDEWAAPGGASGFGSTLAVLGDVTGDAMPDLFVGAKQAREGYVMTVAGVRQYGVVPSEATQTLDFKWVPTDANDSARGRFEVHNGPANSMGFFVVSGGSYVGTFVDASLWVDPTKPGFTLQPILFDASGVYQSDETTLRQANLDGVNLYCQTLALDPSVASGFVTSAALNARLTN